MSGTTTDPNAIPFSMAPQQPPLFGPTGSLTNALLGMSAGFGNAAMPSRMPIPFGAAFGSAMGGLQSGLSTAYQDQLRQAQAQQAQMQNQLTSAQLPFELQKLAGQRELLPALMEYLKRQYQGQGLSGTGQLPGQGPPPITPPGGAGAPATAPGNDLPIVKRDPSQTAGMQANNPGNLMAAGQIGMSGKLPLSGGRTLAVFPDMPTGIAANANQLILNQDQHGINTVRGQVTHWVSDPAADLTGRDASGVQYKNEAGQPVARGSYIGDIASSIGVDPDKPLDFHDQQTLTKYITAMHPHESAPGTLAPEDVTKGVQMALSGARGTQVAGPGGGGAPALQQQPAPRPANPFGAGAFGPQPRTWLPGPSGAAAPAQTPSPDQVQQNVGAITQGMRQAQAGMQPYQVAQAGAGIPTPPSAAAGAPASAFGPGAFGGQLPTRPGTPAGGVGPVAQAPPPPPTASAKSPTRAPTPPNDPVPSNQGQALQLSLQYEAQANQLEQQRNLALQTEKMFGMPVPLPPGDPALLRQKSLQYLEMANAPAKAFAAKQAELQAELAMGPRVKAAEAQATLPTDLMKQGWRLNQQGDLEAFPGGQNDPSYIGAKAAAEAMAAAKVKLATIGPITRQQAMNQNVDIRQNGMSGLIQPDGSRFYVKNPGIVDAQLPDGSTVPMHVSPPPPDAPAGTQGSATPIMGPDGKPIVLKLPQQQTVGREEAVKDFLGKDTEAYAAAQNTQGWLNQIDQAADHLNKAGPAYMTGPLAAERMQLFGGINDVARSLNITPPFDQGALASWEEMRKATTTAGFELSSHYEGHARQAAATIMNATSAVPGVANSPLGLKMVSSGIREGAQSNIDLHEFKQDVYSATGGAGLEAAETAFYRAHTPQEYADRAISNLTPFKINGPDDFQKYLPGTFVTDGKTIDPRTKQPKIIQVPPRTETIKVGRDSYSHDLTIPRYLQGASNAP